MLPGGAEARGELLATLEGIDHCRCIDPSLAALLEAEGPAGWPPSSCATWTARGVSRRS